MDFSFTNIIVLALFIYLTYLVLNLNERLNSMQYRLDRIIKAMDISEDSIKDDLRILINEGKDIKAVKLARETMGFSLLEGKKYVDALKDEDK